jgi:hypothetical protein
MQLQIETIDGNNRLYLKIRPDTGITADDLIMPGKWSVGPGYRIQGNDISSREFAEYFLRAYRDCAVKNSQGGCKNIQDLFMSFQNPLLAEDFMQYISDHYLGDRAKKP